MSDSDEPSPPAFLLENEWILPPDLVFSCRILLFAPVALFFSNLLPFSECQFPFVWTRVTLISDDTSKNWGAKLLVTE